jgi:hypothetical protein
MPQLPWFVIHGCYSVLFCPQYKLLNSSCALPPISRAQVQYPPKRGTLTCVAHLIQAGIFSTHEPLMVSTRHFILVLRPAQHSTAEQHMSTRRGMSAAPTKPCCMTVTSQHCLLYCDTTAAHFQHSHLAHTLANHWPALSGNTPCTYS